MPACVGVKQTVDVQWYKEDQGGSGWGVQGKRRRRVECVLVFFCVGKDSFLNSRMNERMKPRTLMQCTMYRRAERSV